MEIGARLRMDPTHEHEQTGQRRSCHWGGLRVTAFGLAACALGLLLWSRLILVTNHPRTAIAQPEASARVQPSDAGTPEAQGARDGHVAADRPIAQPD